MSFKWFFWAPGQTSSTLCQPFCPQSTVQSTTTGLVKGSASRSARPRKWIGLWWPQQSKLIKSRVAFNAQQNGTHPSQTELRSGSLLAAIQPACSAPTRALLRYLRKSPALWALHTEQDENLLPAFEGRSWLGLLVERNNRVLRPGLIVYLFRGLPAAAWRGEFSGKFSRMITEWWQFLVKLWEDSIRNYYFFAKTRTI